MKTLTYPRIGEKAIWETLPNGLPVCVVPKPGYARKFAFFTTRYGGMDMRFRLDGQWLDTPAGIAHYLEHKMFDTADGSAMHPTQEAIDAFAQEKGYVTVKLLYWPASGGENSQAQAEDFAARLSTAEDKDALYAEMAQQLGIEAGDTGRTFSAETLGDTLSAAFSALEPGQVSDVIATDEGWYVAIGQTLDESSVLDEMFTENVTQARSELTVEYNQGLYDKLDAGDFYSRLTARQSELSSQFSSGSADPGTDSGTGSSTDSDNSGEKEGGSTGSGD